VSVLNAHQVLALSTVKSEVGSCGLVVRVLVRVLLEASSAWSEPWCLVVDVDVGAHAPLQHLHAHAHAHAETEEKESPASAIPPPCQSQARAYAAARMPTVRNPCTEVWRVQ
jgi:hypothetical protein